MIGIIGAGALGLFLGNYLKLNNIDFMIFNDGKIASKLLASGNGRCNLGNVNLKPEYYHKPKYDLFLNYKKEVYDFLKTIGIYTTFDQEGRMYPLSESSASVVNILLKNIKNNIINEKITKVDKKIDGYYLNNYGSFDKVVIAIGSTASIKNTEDFYDLINNLGLDYIKFMPSLVGFKCNNNFKDISGVQSKGLVKLYNNDKLIHSENGKFIFKDEGINGISIMNLSSYYQKLKDKKNSKIIIDFYPNLKTPDNIEGLFFPKLYNYIVKNHLDIHNFIIDIKEPFDLLSAQVAAGGIKLEELNDDLSLKKDKNIYAGGEILNIDGLCGGYNLYFAFSCAYIIGRSIYEIQNRKR